MIGKPNEASVQAPRDPRLRAWLDAAQADADRRGLRDLEPLLDALAAATAALRAADWNDDAER